MRLTKKLLLSFLKNEIYVRVKPSPIHGVGLFAVRDIPKGENPFRSLVKTRYYKIHESDLADFPTEVAKMINDYCSGDKGYIYIPVTGLNPLELGHFINHSDNPNVITVDDGDNFQTTRLIRKGEEVVVDFNTYHSKKKDKPPEMV